MLVVLFLTLVNLRAGAVVAMAIPLALVGVFIGMWAFGVSGNLVSLGAIDFGLVVDGAIIIVENALRRMAEKRDELGRPLVDAERREVVLDASSEVRSATAFGEVIIALVYVPILALQSIEGRMFRPMALTVLFALATAFVLSLTLVPAVASAVLPLAATRSPFAGRGGACGASTRRRSVSACGGRSSSRPRRCSPSSAASAARPRWGASSCPSSTKARWSRRWCACRRSRSSNRWSRRARSRRTLLEFPEVTSVVCRTGRAEIAVDPMGMNMTDIYVMLRPKREWKTADTREGLVEKFDKALRRASPARASRSASPSR